MNGFGARESVGIRPHNSPFLLSALASVVARSLVVSLMFSVCDPSQSSVHTLDHSSIQALKKSAHKHSSKLTLDT